MPMQAVNDGLTRLEVEFPALPNSVDGAVCFLLHSISLNQDT